jgi:ferritin-like metal-binding protein YciE
MTPSTLEEQLIKYLTDAHAIEEQALVQMRMAPKAAGDPQIAQVFEQHGLETEAHESMVRRRLQEHGAEPAALKEMAAKATGAGFALFAQLQLDTPGKLVAHAFSYEHMELAAHELVAQVAERAGDGASAAAARQIRSQEAAMAQRLEGLFDRAVAASLGEPAGAGDRELLEKRLTHYLGDAHALEEQSIRLLDRAQLLAGPSELSVAYEEHLAETREHQRLIEERLEAHGARPSWLKDAALSLGALNWGGFFAAQPDTAVKLAAFAYAYEHLEIASHELLRRVARRAGDAESEAVLVRILDQERAAADRVFSLLPAALELTLEERGVLSAHPHVSR